MAELTKLTKAEEDIMQYFWDHGPNTVSNIIGLMSDPKPPHSTISSIVRILEQKRFLDHKAYGRTYEYFPIIEKKTYTRLSIKSLVGRYFEGSMNELVSFLVKDEQVDIQDLSELIDQLENENK